MTNLKTKVQELLKITDAEANTIANELQPYILKLGIQENDGITGVLIIFTDIIRKAEKYRQGAFRSLWRPVLFSMIAVVLAFAIGYQWNWHSRDAELARRVREMQEDLGILQPYRDFGITFEVVNGQPAVVFPAVFHGGSTMGQHPTRRDMRFGYVKTQPKPQTD